MIKLDFSQRALQNLAQNNVLKGQTLLGPQLAPVRVSYLPDLGRPTTSTFNPLFLDDPIEYNSITKCHVNICHHIFEVFDTEFAKTK